MNEDSKYKYPDSNEHLSRPQDNGYWEQSEMRLINWALFQLIKSNRTPADMHMLDAGCGEGRLIGHYEPFFREITAIDPDRKRLESAREKAMYWGCINKFTFVPSTVQSFEFRESFDFILCNHVLEHLSIGSLTQTIEIFGKNIKEDGLVLLTTAHSEISDHFIKSYEDKNSQQVTDYISLAEFNELCDKPVDGVLPVNKKTLASFESFLNDSSLEVIDKKIYQIAEDFGDLGKIFFKDHIVNSNDHLRDRLGQNMAFLCKRR